MTTSPLYGVPVQVDWLFLHTLEDLERRVAKDATEYDILMSAALLRKLMLDSDRLVDQVNRSRRLKITFRINEPGAYEEMVLSDGPSFWALADGLEPDWALVEGETVDVPRDRMLNRRMIVVGGNSYSIADVIGITANVLGAVHVGSGKDDSQRTLAQINSELRIGGISAAVRALPPISRVVLRGLGPLRVRVREEQAGGDDSELPRG